MHRLTRACRHLVAAGVVAYLISGCSSSKTDISCAEFLRLPAAEQADIAALWGAEARGAAEPSELEQATASAVAREIAAFCASDSNARIADLTFSIG